MSRINPITSAVWPQPPDNFEYPQQKLAGGLYVATGLFPKGASRKAENCVRVTSLLFDADCVTLAEALAQKAGTTLGATADDRKAALYAMPEDEVDELRDRIIDLVGHYLSELLGCEPTAIIDTGWGFHFHYAVCPSFTRSDMPLLKYWHKRITTEVNRRCSEHEECDWEALDNTSDVGSRLARMPGTSNTKAPGKMMLVGVIEGNPSSVFDRQHVLGRLTRWAVDNPEQSSPGLTSPERPSPGRPAAPRPSSRMDHRRVDFSTMFLNSGETWQSIVDQMAPGERQNTICPEGGNSVGSAFFAVEGDGTSKLISNASNIVWHNTYIAPPPAAPEPGTRRQKQATDRATLTQRRNAQGQPVGPEPTLRNLMRVLVDDGRWNLWFDSFSHQEMQGDAPLRDDAYIDLLLILEQDYGWRSNLPGKERCWDAILRVCHEFPRNPVGEYLRGLVWDGVPRLDSWVHHVIYAPAEAVNCPTKELPLHAAFGRKWAIALVARALEPGCQMDTMLVLAGRQGFRKSSIFRAWAGKWFVDTELDPRSKDKYMVLNKAWIYEDAELASGSRADEESRKSFLTSTTDFYRSPYARAVTEVPRHFVVTGSTNEDSFLKDATGSRRYWVIEVPSFRDRSDNDPSQPKADTDWLRANRDQLLAEAVALYDGGKRRGDDYIWWLSPDEDNHRAESNASFSHKSAWDEAACQVFEANRGGQSNAIDATDFAKSIEPDLGASAIARIGLTLATALRRAGFVKGAQRKGRTTWVKPIPEGTVPMPGTGLDVVERTPERRESSFRE
jgi:predicted P-loop ATPase